MTINVFNADCLEWLRQQPDNSIDAVVCDPPYGLSNTKPAQVADVLKAWVTGDMEAVPAKKGGFMGADWDSFVPPPAVWEECLRVLKPGGHMAVFAGARTQDLMGLSIRLAGFEIRDTLGWVYGSGFPKSMDISKAIDKAAGAEREVVGTRDTRKGNGGTGHDFLTESSRSPVVDITSPATSSAKQWNGWGTALKPAIEPIILARKPLDGTVAANVLAHGVGGLNIDACRVPTDEIRVQGSQASTGATPFGGAREGGKVYDKGRFPANVLLDEHAAQEMDKQSGWRSDRGGVGNAAKEKQDFPSSYSLKGAPKVAYNGGGGASRYFPVFKYQAKAPKKERPVVERENGTKIQHPTVKPEKLMEWLCTLITPEGGTILDPFAGSGTTLQAARNKGFNAIGIEAEKDYIELINQRLNESETQCAN